tara:strand:+ start:645 stop:1367 length:723 start_codon:yes stop_codon:yes gene_type:complete
MMKHFVIKSMAAIGLWFSCSALVFWIAGCTPNVQTEKETTDEVEKKIGAAPAYGDPGPGTITDTAAAADTAGSVDTVPEVLKLGFLETECGHNISDSACDFRLLDQNDNPWKLSDHLGDVVLLDLSAMWCTPCKSAAATAQATQDDYAYKGFHYVTILVVDAQNNTVDASEATHWADTFSITSAPVLQGSRDLLVSGGATHGYPLSSWPTFVFLDRTHTVAYGIYGFNEEWIRQVVEGLL